MQAQRKQLDDGRWHFQHGPIDLIISAEGDAVAIERAFNAGWERFGEILPELVRELRVLRQPLQRIQWLRSPVANRMLRACWPHRAQFITPMAAVAGAVADELIGFFSAQPAIQRASINNGGDIALHLRPGASYQVGLVSNIAHYSGVPHTCFSVSAELPVRGIATSGWRGRSMSLGIADSVTVLAETAAMADAAATIIANAVNAQHDAIRRAPAHSLKDDADLGDLLVTTDVGVLPVTTVEQALQHGEHHAQQLWRAGVIFAAHMALQGQSRAVGFMPARLPVASQRAA